MILFITLRLRPCRRTPAIHASSKDSFTAILCRCRHYSRLVEPTRRKCMPSWEARPLRTDLTPQRQHRASSRPPATQVRFCQPGRGHALRRRNSAGTTERNADALRSPTPPLPHRSTWRRDRRVTRDIFGDGVNVAARPALSPNLAESVSGWSVRDQVRDREWHSRLRTGEQQVVLSLDQAASPTELARTLPPSPRELSPPW